MVYERWVFCSNRWRVQLFRFEYTVIKFYSLSFILFVDTSVVCCNKVITDSIAKIVDVFWLQDFVICFRDNIFVLLKITANTINITRFNNVTTLRLDLGKNFKQFKFNWDFNLEKLSGETSLLFIPLAISSFLTIFHFNLKKYSRFRETLPRNKISCTMMILK